MDQQWTPPKKACIDLTLIWGADSYLTSTPDAPSDPWGEESFRQLIDVSLGTTDVFFPIPEDDNDVAARVLGSALTKGAALPGSSYKSRPLKPNVELAVVEGFRNLLSGLNSRTKLARWLAYQLGNRRLEAYTDWKDEKRQPITPGGADAWRRCKDEMLTLATDLPIAANEKDLKERYAISTVASSAREFALLYAFDGYRRGWQYTEYAGTMSAVYFPHALRDTCLDSGGDSWKTIERLTGLSLSWSRYFLNLIHEQPDYRSGEMVSQLLSRIRGAIRDEGGPQWTHIQISEAMDSIATRKPPEQLLLMFAHLTRIAERAELPLLKKRPNSPLHEKALTLLASHLMKLGTDANPIIAPLMWLFEGVAKTIKLIPAGKVWIDEKESAIPTMLFRGRYGYRGLVPVDYESALGKDAARY